MENNMPSINVFNDTSTLAEDGQISRLDERTLQGTPCPIAASTVNRTGKGQPNFSDIYGSFLDGQNLSALQEISPQLQHELRLSFENMVPKDNTGRPNSAQSQVFTSSSQTSTTDRCQDSELSARSSLGIINVNQMDDLEHSILPMDSLKLLNEKTNTNPSMSSSRGSTLDSQSWEGGSKDSKSFPPIGRSGLDTVKKKPTEQASRSSFGRKIAHQAALMFGGDFSEADTSVYEVEFNDKELDQLDEDFSDVGDIDDSDDDSGMGENIRAPMKQQLLDLQNVDSFKKLFRRSDNFAGEGQEFEQESTGANSDRFNSLYLRPTPHSIDEVNNRGFKSNIFGDDTDDEETEMSMNTNHPSQLQRLRCSQNSSDIDTEDELEAARQDLASNSKRNYIEVGQRPGLEGETSDNYDLQLQNSHPLGFRQSAEGDVVSSPVPGDGGGGGDGSSGSDSDGNVPPQIMNRQTRSAFSGMNSDLSYTHQTTSYLQEERVKPLGEDLMSNNRFNSAKKHMVKDNASTKLDVGNSVGHLPNRQINSATSSISGSVGSTFDLDDTLTHEPQLDDINPQTVNECKNMRTDPGLRLDASGYNANDSLQNKENDPFDYFASSFGSFGMGSQKPNEDSDAVLPQGISGMSGVQSMKEYEKSVFDSPVFREKPNSHAKLGKKFISDKSPVYVDESGEVVTDLAFHCQLPNTTEQQDLIEEDQFGFSSQDAFSAPDMAKKMLDNDEKEFVKDKTNIFMQDANMAAAAGDFNSSFRSCIMNNTYSIMDEDQAYMRISIGAYIASRTEALGSLDGDGHQPRPDFGMVVKTPPNDRKPVSLFDASTREEDKTFSSDVQNASRSDGVGNEGDKTMTPEASLTLEDLDTGSRLKPPVVTKNKLLKVSGSEDSLSGVSDVSSSSISNKTGVLDISTIGKFISSLSPNSQSKKIADLIMHLSDDKASQKRKASDSSLKNEETVAQISKNLHDSPSSKVKSTLEEGKTRRSRLPVKMGSSLSQSRLMTGDAYKQMGSEQIDKKRTNSLGSFESCKSSSVPDKSTEKNGRKHNNVLKSNRQSKSSLISKGEQQEKTHDKVVNYKEQPSSASKDHSSFVDNLRTPTMNSTDLNGHQNVQVIQFEPDVGDEKILCKTESDMSVKSREPSIEKARDHSWTNHSPPREKFVHLYDTITTIDTINSPHKDLENTNDKIPDMCDSRSPRLSIGYFSRASGLTNDSSFKPQLNFINEVEDNDIDHKLGKESWRTVSEKDLDITMTDTASKFTKPFSPVLHVSASKELSLNTQHSLSPSKSHVEWAGHHVPDGTEYSSVSMQAQSGKDAREFIVGTSDIQTAESRGFDTLASKDSNFTGSVINRYSTFEEHTADQDNHNVRNSIDDFSALRADRSSVYHHPEFHTSASDSTQLSRASMGGSDSIYHELHGIPATPSFRIPELSVLTVVEAPGTLQFPTVCCVGTSSRILLPIRNPTSRWVECMLYVKSLVVDGRAANSGTDLPFDFKRKVIIQPQKSEDISVIFLPRVDGSFVAHLQIISYPFSQSSKLDAERIPTEVTIQAVADFPRIMVQADDGDVLNFDEVQWGSSKCETLKIINVGRAHVPLRLSINSKHSTWHCFSIEGNNQDLYAVSKTSRPNSPALGTYVINFPLYGCDEKVNSVPHEVQVHCSPPDRRIDRVLKNGPPERISATVDVNLDLPNSNRPPLHQILLKATVGVAKLHIHRDLEVIDLKAASGETDKTSFNLINAGNLTLQVHLSIPDCGHVFTIVPTSVTIPPGHDGKVTILFSPEDSSMNLYKTVLFMKQEPGDLAFELDLQGSIKQKPPPKKVLLMSDKRLLAYGGVQIGDTGYQKITLLNNSDQSMKVHLEIHPPSGEFQIQTPYGSSEKMCSVRDLMLHSKEKYPLYILFFPQAVSAVSGKLVIRPCDVKLKFSIPMIGYGGLSKIIMEKVNSSSEDKFWIDLGIFESGTSLSGKATVYNIGERAAYVCASYFSDIHCKHSLPPGRLTIEPSSFVIKKNDKQTVSIVYHSSVKQDSRCAGKQELLAAIAFFFGDEVSRVKYRRALIRGCGKYHKLSSDDPRYGMKFDCRYMYEDCTDVKKEVTANFLIDCSNDVEIFYNGMSKVVLSLLGEARKPDPATSSCKSIHRSLSLKALPESRPRVRVLNDVSVSQDVPLCKVENLMSPSAKHVSDKENESWLIQPEQLVLEAKNAVEKFQIINFTNRNMKFDLYWPGHWVVVTPESGTVGARSSCTVSISPSPQISRNNLPWSGSVVVTCDSQLKMLKVQVRKSSKTEVSTANSTTSSMVSVNANQSQIPPQCPSLDVDSASLLTVFPKEINFSDRETEQSIEIKNICLEPILWMISPFAPVYVKGIDQSANVYRVEDTVFEIDSKQRLLKPSHSEKIPICFHPKCKGSFTQTWEIQFKKQHKKQSGMLSKQNSIRINITGEGFQKVSQSRKEVSDKENMGEVNKDQNRRSTESVVLVENKLTIQTKAMQKNVEKFCFKNLDFISHKIKIEQPQPPFYVKYSECSMQARKYLKCPVEFRPSDEGVYNQQLVCHVDNGCKLILQLEGICRR